MNPIKGDTCVLRHCTLTVLSVKNGGVQIRVETDRDVYTHMISVAQWHADKAEEKSI